MPEQQKEKKVEFIELIYDLIFVYIVGRNNALLHHVDNGLVTSQMFIAYIVCTLAIIQIWNFTTFYINIYGRNSVRDHVFLFINMYLLYYIANGISVSWEHNFYHFNVAWALILVNIGVQYLLELRNHKDSHVETLQLKRKAAIILGEAAMVGVNISIYYQTGTSFAYIPILFGFIGMVLSGRLLSKVPVDFAHLSERAMLYVVFTFGEMIISLSTYFNGELTGNNFYFSTMAFLIVVGLFLSYGVLYNRIIDRDTVTNGTSYMMIHVFLIFALNNISVALEFMQDDQVDLMQKTILLVVSFVMYFTFLFLTAAYAKRGLGFSLRFILALVGIILSFAALMFFFRENMYVNIAVSVIYVYGIFLLLLLHSKRIDQLN